MGFQLDEQDSTTTSTTLQQNHFPFPLQYRSFNHIYLLQKKPTGVYASVLDIHKKVLWKQAVMVDFDNIKTKLKSPNNTLVGELSHVLPSQYHIQPSVENILENCKKDLLKEIEKGVAQFPRAETVPNFSVFQRENPKLSLAQLQTGHAYVTENILEEALACFKMSFQYTKDWHDYTCVPDVYNKLFQKDSSYLECYLLSLLYLASYQLQDNQTQFAIDTLEVAQKLPLQQGLPTGVTLVLLRLYLLNDQVYDALSVIINVPDEEACASYRTLLTLYPQNYDGYELYSQLVPDTSEKIHILLKGLQRAIVHDTLMEAEKLGLKVKQHNSIYLLDHLFNLELSQNQKEYLSEFVTNAEAKSRSMLQNDETSRQLLKALKLLEFLEKKAEYYSKIVQLYKTLGKKNKLTFWYKKWIDLLLKNQDWTKAKEVAYEALQNTPKQQNSEEYENASTEDIAEILKKLDIAFDNIEQTSSQRADVLEKLGRVYLSLNDAFSAEKTFVKAYKTFGSIEQAFSLGEALSSQQKIEEAVKLYYEASTLALMKTDFQKLQNCVDFIKTLDPALRFLAIQEKTNLFTLSILLQLVGTLDANRQETRLLKEQVEALEAKLK